MTNRPVTALFYSKMKSSNTQDRQNCSAYRPYRSRRSCFCCSRFRRVW